MLSKQASTVILLLLGQPCAIAVNLFDRPSTGFICVYL